MDCHDISPEDEQAMLAALESAEAQIHASRPNRVITEQPQQQSAAHAGAGQSQPTLKAHAAAGQAGVATADASGLARAMQISGLIQSCEGTLRALKDKHRGRSGRYPKADHDLKSKLDAELVLLRSGQLPSEFQKPVTVSKHSTVAAARADPSTQARLVHVQQAKAGR